ncbi:uncharacterized protein A1O9_11151 [Exophiala aquamarina CBS 119918]|uniref:NAD-dependent epimerase/dehydratase domain-containing protein n=1 Tax=Exophiala aquamarina CBS 119918 TaxID=1182545 RepID=A0A072NXY0_9EURO|nr:uncharacterized protein A1O9_11151 [Exophiala aquamarina CBS 119918]KEF52734.1 hypothetical protein A1O9_11151 [Exophiala aquamarina CBS 119918]
MPHAEPSPIKPPSRVVVTGANGFIASHVISQLLLLGFQVVGTVRSQNKADAVRKTHEQLSPESARLLETAVVENIINPEAYSALFNSCQPVAILHLASPFGYSVDDHERDLMQPAVRGTEAVLKAAAKTPSVRRIIHTNSFACIYDASLGPRPGHVYTSKHWCPLTYEDGVKAANAPIAYRASKAVAEKTAWEFMVAPQFSGGFDLVSLCPAMVFGPFLDTPFSMPHSSEGLNTSNKLVWDVVSAGEQMAVPPTKGPVWVDVRDVAEAHVRALTNPSLGGRRMLLAQGVYCSQEIADVAREVARKHSHRIPIGCPGKREAETHFGVDSGVEASDLRIKWRNLSETLSDLLPQLYRIESS